MSQQISEEQQVRDVSVAQVSPGDAAPVITKINGKCGIPVLIAPYQGPSNGREGAAAAQQMSTAFQGFLLLQEEQGKEEEEDPATLRKKWFKEMRGWLMVLATVAASVTYQAGLNPPGGFWQDDPADRSHHAGDPALRDEHHTRYLIFYYFNATAFVTSLVIMVLLMSERFYHTEAKVLALMLTTFVDLASLVGAYVAGTTRYFSSCIYVIVITCVAFVGVIYIGEGMTEICAFIIATFPCMAKLENSRWFPIPDGVMEDAKKKRDRREAERKRRQAERRNNPGTCSPCCAPLRVAA